MCVHIFYYFSIYWSDNSLAKKKKKTPAVKFLELIFRNNFFIFNFRKCVRDEKYSGRSPPTSPNSFNILDAAGSSVLRCTL